MAAAAKSTASLDTYRVDTVCGEQGNTFQVVRCELVARFDLDQTQAVRLFTEHSYDVTEGEAAAQAVAARIRQMIAALNTPIQEAQDR